MHSFRFNQVFALAGNGVIGLSPQGGAAAELYVRILTTTLHYCFIVTTRLSNTVSDLFKFLRKPEMTSLCYLR